MADTGMGAAVAVPAAGITISVLYDNRAQGDFEAAWGFSCLVTGTERTILFDTGGDGDILLRNMTRLGVEPDTVETIVLSHAHWDHTGGLRRFIELAGEATVVSPGPFRDELNAIVADAKRRTVASSEPLPLCRGVSTTGEMGRSIPEQALVIGTDRGLIVITGCAHPGIVAIVERAKALFGGDMLLVMGGFHLMEKSAAELDRIIGDFKRLGVRYAGPCHCTGDGAIASFAEAYGERFVEINAGARIRPADLE